MASTRNDGPLFDRLHRIVLEEHPEAEVALSYGMPGYRVGKRRLNLGVWKHGCRSTAGGATATGDSCSATRRSRAARRPCASARSRRPRSRTTNCAALLGGALEP